MLCLLFFSKMHALISLRSPNPMLLLYQLPQRSDSRQSNKDLLPQIQGKASKDTIPTFYSIKTHHTHKITISCIYNQLCPFVTLFSVSSSLCIPTSNSPITMLKLSLIYYSFFPFFFTH